jgi:hypothetical protein
MTKHDRSSLLSQHGAKQQIARNVDEPDFGLTRANLYMAVIRLLSGIFLALCVALLLLEARLD